MSLCPLILLFFNRPSTQRCKGFTLLEVLIAISIFAVVISSIYGVFTSISGTKDRLDNNSETYHQARIILDRLGREIHGIYVHSAENTNILRGGVNDQGNVFLELSTTATSSLNIDGAEFVFIRYDLVEDQEKKDGSYVINRIEKPLLGSMSNQNFPAMRLATGIKNFRIRYFSDQLWQDQWDQDQQNLPDMLEVFLSIYDNSGEEISFLTAFKIPLPGGQL
ncbi:MAG: type II secretion system GspH family protein [Deltaproteobacteria bacterium]|jgi:general secretion pathway protein J|nr:type II secretion system GspH family protein [Deltaproteobacteria bacterium]MCW8893277.1 type II secretion system GspH family protein [Deltaproteobacteria bacterium]MCW9050317.1 type II secretion system GspH family protein [Deltaproteobacteria bacterium]